MISIVTLYLNCQYTQTFLYECLFFPTLTIMKLHPSAILFDMDGVLVDSLDSWWKALNSALKRFKHQEITREEFIKTYWGHDLKANLKRLDLNPEVARFCNVTYENHLDYISIYPDTKATLQKLSLYRKVIITNTPTDCTKQILQKFHIEPFFEEIVTSDDVTKAKPDPEIVFTACQHLGVNPNSVVLIGDTKNDVQAGRLAGCTVIGLNVSADYTIKRLLELPDLLQ
jgi:HAD superfamily hydrolase (TIGR01509 family)